MLPHSKREGEREREKKKKKITFLLLNLSLCLCNYIRLGIWRSGNASDFGSEDRRFDPYYARLFQKKERNKEIIKRKKKKIKNKKIMKERKEIKKERNKEIK